MLSCLWDGAYKRTLAVNSEREAYVAAAGFFLTIRMVLNHMPDAVTKMC